MRSWGNEGARVWGRLREAGCGVPAGTASHFPQAGRIKADIFVHPVRVSDGGGGSDWLSG